MHLPVRALLKKIDLIQPRLAEVYAGSEAGIFSFAEQHVGVARHKDRFYWFCAALKPGFKLENVWSYPTQSCLMPDRFQLPFLAKILSLTFEFLCENENGYDLLRTKYYPDCLGDLKRLTHIAEEAARDASNREALVENKEVWQTIYDAINLLIDGDSEDCDHTQFFELWRVQRFIRETGLLRGTP